jgi:hypothetical protein
MTLPKKQNKTSLPTWRFAKPNALKHGVFSSIQILPWEDPDAFEQLRRELWEEHKPEGPSQEDCVETILWCRWRNLRLRARQQLETAAALQKPQYHVFTVEPRPLFDTYREGVFHALKNRPAYTARDVADDYSRLLSFSNSFYRDRDRRNVDWSFQFLPKEFRDHLEKHVPESNFESRENWIVAMKKEVDTVLLPMVKDRRPDPGHYKVAAAEFLASDKMVEDLEVEERLDATMDRALRRLSWLKAQKELEREKAQKLVNGKATPRLG